MAKITKYKVNSKKEVEGVWIPAGDGLELKIARLGNPRYLEYIRVNGSHLRSMIRAAGDQTPAELIPIIRKAFATRVLLDWKNLEDENDKLVEYSAEAAEKYITEYPEFYLMVQQMANDVNNFREDELAVATGNS